MTIQFSENHFAEAYNPTIENTFHKTLKHKGTEYELEIIDTVRLQNQLSMGGEAVLDRCFDSTSLPELLIIFFFFYLPRLLHAATTRTGWSGRAVDHALPRHYRD